MKKKVLAIWVMAVLLTGCGSTAPAAESNGSAEENSAAAESSSQDESSEYRSIWGFEFPVPEGMTRLPYDYRYPYSFWKNDDENVPVYYAGEFYTSSYQDPSYTLEQLPDAVLETVEASIYGVYKSNTQKYSTAPDRSKYIIESTTEGEYLGFPALHEKGYLTTYEGIKVNYIFHYAYVDYPAIKEYHVPTFFFIFSDSDKQEALDLMDEYSDFVLKNSKFYDD
ncbi:MAG: hypothetical protein IK134_14350 [Oscillospiraceae bacterium]|nr:hypothetical protein [Oscillospiraceae bacterium]